MATVPTANLGIRVPRPGAPAMDPGARGFRVNLGSVIQAQQAPVLNERAFAVGAGANIGAGLQNAGGALLQISEAQARIVNRKRELEADGMMVERETAIANLIASEPDERKWGMIAEKEAAASEKLWLSDDLSPDARDAIQAKSMLWRQRLVSETTRASFERSLSDLGAEYEKRRMMAVEAGDLSMAHRQIDAAEADGLLAPDRAEMLRIRSKEVVEAKQREWRREQIESAAADDPDGWLAENQEPGRMDIDDWQAGQATARRVQSARVDAAATEIGDAMATGDVKSVNDIERIAAGRLSPAALADAKSNLEKLQSDAWRSENLSEAGVTKNFGLLLSEVERYDKAQDPDGSKYAGLVFRVKTLMPEELRGEITQPLARKWNPGNGPDAPEPIKGLVRETLRNWFDDGKFGVTRKRVPLAPEDPGYYPSTKEMKWVDDPPARDAAATRRAQAEMEMSKWLKENPNASAKEAKEQLLRSSTAALLPGDVSALLRKPPPAAPAVDPATRLKEIGMRFGGQRVPPTGELGAPHLTVFGGPNDPDDNGLSAFGGPTGPGGREGVAVPEKILRHFYGGDKDTWKQVQVEATLPDGTKQVLPIADLGTAEWVWARNGKPVMDLTEGAVEQLGGDVIYGKNGTLKGVKGLDGVKFRLLPLNSQKPPFSE